MALEISIILARFWGILMVVVCLLFLVRKKSLDYIFRASKDKAFMLISGYLAFILGLITVILHNIWVADWRVVITVFGWFSLVKGVARIGFPEFVQKAIQGFKNKPAILINALLIFVILLGAWLIWMSCFQAV